MRNKYKNELLLILFPIASIIMTAVLYSIMPDQIPAGYTLKGMVSHYTDKSAIVFIIPVLSLFFYLYFLLVPIIDRQHDSYERFRRAYTIMRLTGTFALFLINAAYILNIFYPDRVELVIAFKAIIAVGLLFFGDKLPKVKRNHFIGVVNPWTLKSEIVWLKTQRFTGTLMFSFSIVLLILSFINLDWTNAVYMALILIIVLAPHIYSANTFYQKINPKRR